MSAEVRSRLVSQVAEALDKHLTEYGQGIAAWKDRDPPGKALAEVAVRTVCDLIAYEIAQTELAQRRTAVGAGLTYAASLVRSLGQP